MATATENLVQKCYVAYYGRPADAAGLQFWTLKLDQAGGNLDAIIAQFGNSAESNALYTGSSTAKVTAIYQLMFNRAPDSAGLAFYVGKLDAGQMTGASVALDIANGATGTDATTIANRVTVANAFTDALIADSAASDAYAGTTAAQTARSFLSTITTTATTSGISAVLSTLKADGGDSGDEIVLTSATDEQDFSSLGSAVTVRVNGDDDATDGDEFDVKGTDFDDTFIVESYKDVTINGGEGVDTLDLREMSPGDGDADVNLSSGIGDANLSPGGGDSIFLNFENVIASDDGGRITGTSESNTVTLGEGNDDVSLGAGDDFVVMTDDTFATGDDSIDGGSGDDTVSFSGTDTPSFTTDDLIRVESLIVTGEGDDVNVTIDELFDVSTAPTAHLTGALTSVTIEDGADDTVTITSTNDVNLVGVSFEGVETLDVTADDNNVYVDENTLVGVDQLTAVAGDTLNLAESGTYDFSGLTFDTIDQLEGSADDDTIYFGKVGDLTDVDTGQGKDRIEFKDVSVGDLSTVTTLAAGDELTLAFGSADYVTILDDNSDQIDTVVGGSGEDTLVLEGTDATLSALDSVERVVIDSAGADSTLTLMVSLDGDVEIFGDSGDDTVQIGDSDVSIEDVTFTDVEILDLNDEDVTASVASLTGLTVTNGSGASELTVSDGGTLTLDLNDVAGDLAIVFSEASVLTVTDANDDAGAISITMGTGADRLILTDSDLAIGNDADSDITLGKGNDALRIATPGDVAGTNSISGGLGTDTLELALTTGALTIAAGALDEAVFNGFETIKTTEAAYGNISITLGNEDDIGVTTIDISSDTNALGANTIDVSAFDGGALTITGSGDVETVTTGVAGDTVNVAAGADDITVTGSNGDGVTYTLTLGAGVDNVTIDNDVIGDANTDSDLVVITDYSADTIDISAFSANDTYTQTISQAYFDDVEASTLALSLDAFAALDLSGNDSYVAIFQFDGDTYIFCDDGDGSYTDGNDLVIKLVGEKTVDLDDITT
jgi:S-layer protein